MHLPVANVDKRPNMKSTGKNINNKRAVAKPQKKTAYNDLIILSAAAIEIGRKESIFRLCFFKLTILERVVKQCRSDIDHYTPRGQSRVR